MNNEAKIIVNYQPFDLYQTVSVYDGKNFIIETIGTIDEINMIVDGFCNEFNISKIELHGIEQYLSRFAAEMSTLFTNREVNIVSED